MQKETNDQLNNANYKVSEGEYAGFNVRFEFEFRNGGSTIDLINPPKDTYANIPITNTFARGNEITHKGLFTPRENPNGTISTTGGVTSDHKNILMNKNIENKRQRIHEMFHTLFFDYDDAKRGIGSYIRSGDMPNQDDINKLINNSKLQKIENKPETPNETTEIETPYVEEFDFESLKGE